MDVNAAIATVKAKRTVHCVDWCPSGFKVSQGQGRISVWPVTCRAAGMKTDALVTELSK